MGLIISRAEASCLPKKTQTLVELKRKMSCKQMSISLPSTKGSHSSFTGSPSPRMEETSPQGSLGPNPIPNYKGGKRMETSYNFQLN